MNVQDLFRTVSWDDVAQCLTEVTEIENEENLAEYKKVFEEVKACEPVPNDGTIVCVQLVQDKEEAWFDVYGRVPGKDISYALELSTFEEWAGYAIDENTLREMPSPKIAAHVLWEMTWFGFSNEDILVRRKAIEELAGEVIGSKQITTENSGVTRNRSIE